jgi:hypothetical protein
MLLQHNFLIFLFLQLVTPSDAIEPAADGPASTFAGEHSVKRDAK